MERVLCVRLAPIISTNPLRNSSDHPHFSGQETEAQKERTSYLRSQGEAAGRARPVGYLSQPGVTGGVVVLIGNSKSESGPEHDGRWRQG